MDKVLSARVDESVLHRISVLARELHTSKKAVIEGAVNMFAERVEKEHRVDALDQTFGAWKRKETARATVHRTRDAFNKAMTRHHS